MALDIKQWLTGEMGFTEDETKTLLPQFTADRIQKLDKGYLRQSDYSKHMDEFKSNMTKAQAKLTADSQALNGEIAEWSKLKGADTEAREKAEQRVAALEQRLFTHQQHIRKLATDAGVDPTPFLKDDNETPVPPTKPATPPAPTVDLSPFAKNTDVAAMNQYLFDLQVELATLVPEHQALFGTPLDARKLAEEIRRRAAAKEDITPRAVWEETFDVATTREAKAKEHHDAEIAAAEQRGREAALSEGAIPHASPAGKHAVVFQPRRDDQGQPVGPALERPRPQQRVASAAQALATGKYRQSGSIPAAPTPPGQSPGSAA
jgi:hypothetical protein